MLTIPFEMLYHTDFQISEPMAKKQYWHARGNVYNAIGKPKISHTLLWFKNCRGIITDKHGLVLHAAQNQLVYMAKGIEYRVDFFDTNTDREDTVVIHFQLTDVTGEDIAPILHPFLCMKHVDPAFAMLMENMADEYKSNIVCMPELKAAVYTLLSDICGHQRRKRARNKFSCIQAGIKLMEQNSDMKLSDIAAVCGVSDCYFRRLFKEYSGESPMEFRQHYRIEKAKQLLLSDEQLSIGEIAEELNFTDIYHFSKTFKKYVHLSPTEFIGDMKQAGKLH